MGFGLNFNQILYQTIAIGWVYGVNKFASNVEQMTGMLPNKYWVCCWGVVAPLVMGVIFLFYCVKVNIIITIIIFFMRDCLCSSGSQ